MHWDAVPVEEGSSPILAYRLQYKASTDATYTALDTELSAASRTTTVQVLVLHMVIVALLLRLDRIVQGLGANTSYVVRTAARSKLGLTRSP